MAQLDPGNPDYLRLWSTWRRPALLQYAASVRAHEAAYDDPVLADFRMVVALTRRAFADLIENDQGRWVMASAETPGLGLAEAGA